jgi:hypothetical protein
MKKSLLLFAIINCLNLFSTNIMAQTPNWKWAKSAAGSGNDISYSVATDNNSNIIITGSFSSPSITFGTTILTNSILNGRALFIAKYDSLGNVLWAKSTGSGYYDEGMGVTIDADNNIIVTGSFSSASITFDNTTLTQIGMGDIFVVKYDASGNVIWAKSAGGSYEDYSNSIIIDKDENILLSGCYYSPVIIWGGDTLINSNTNSPNIFIAKYDRMGHVLWAKSAGGDAAEYAQSITTDSNNDIIIAGGYYNMFAIGNDTLINSSNNSFNVFIAKYNSSGNVLWAKSATGSNNDYANSIVTDFNNNIIITGGYFSPSFTLDSITLTKVGKCDIFIAKYDASGKILWAKTVGNTNDDESMSVAVDNTGNYTIAGYFISAFIYFETIKLTNLNMLAKDIFIAKYDSYGNVLWAKSAGGNNDDYANSIAIDANGNTIITGGFNSPSILFGNMTITNANTSFPDIYIAKLASSNVGIIENSLSNSNISFYPNPATDKITINTADKVTMEILNTDGQIIKSIINHTGDTPVDIRDLPSGFYIVTLKTENEIVTNKFVKE